VIPLYNEQIWKKNSMFYQSMIHNILEWTSGYGDQEDGESPLYTI